jgi:hypothetical protein
MRRWAGRADVALIGTFGVYGLVAAVTREKVGDGGLEGGDHVIAGPKREFACGAMRDVGYEREAAVEHHTHTPADRLNAQDPPTERITSARCRQFTRDHDVVGRDADQRRVLAGRGARGDFDHAVADLEVGELGVRRRDMSGKDVLDTNERRDIGIRRRRKHDLRTLQLAHATVDEHGHTIRERQGLIAIVGHEHGTESLVSHRVA